MTTSTPPERRRSFGPVSGRLLLRLALLGSLLGALGAFHLAISDLGWGVTHHWRASGFGVSFPVPWGWRQIEGSDPKRRIDLRNAVGDLRSLLTPDQISVWQASLPFDPVEEAQRWERLGTRLMVPGDRLEPTPRDSFLLAQARCSDVKRSQDGRISFACFDKGGRWVAVYIGREHNRDDLPLILRRVLAATP